MGKCIYRWEGLGDGSGVEAFRRDDGAIELCVASDAARALVAIIPKDEAEKLAVSIMAPGEGES